MEGDDVKHFDHFLLFTILCSAKSRSVRSGTR